MKRRFLLPSALLGALLFVGAPALGTAPTAVWKSDSSTATLQTVSADYAAGEMFTAPATLKNDTLRITGQGANTTRVAFFGTRDGSAAFARTFADISIEAVSTYEGRISGFRYDSKDADFAGSLIGHNITVSHLGGSHAGGSGSAYGIELYNRANTPTIANLAGTATIRITGLIDVNGGAGAAHGLIAGNLEANSEVTINAVKARANNNFVYGIKVSGAHQDAAFNVGSIDVAATGTTGDRQAVGLKIGQMGTIGNAHITLTGGEIKAVSGTNGIARGILGRDLFITLAGDVNIEATKTGGGGSAFGIESRDLALNVADRNLTVDNMNITQDFGITGSGGSVTATGNVVVGRGFAAGVCGNGETSRGHTLGNALTINANTVNVGAAGAGLHAQNGGVINATVNSLTVTGAGVSLGAFGNNSRVIASVDDLTTTRLWAVGENGGKVELATNLAKATFSEAGQSQLLGDVTLYAYGEANTSGTVGFQAIDSTVQLINRAIFTGYAISGNSIVTTANLEYANHQNEFLVAAMMHNRYTGLNMVRDKFISAQPRRNGFRGQAWNCDPCAPVACDPCAPVGFLAGGSATRTAWVNYIGRGDTFGDWDITSNGVQVGSDLFRNNRTQFGAIFGYEGSQAKRSNTFTHGKVDADNTYVGVYAARVLRNKFDVRALYNHGWQKFDMERDYCGDVYASNFKGRTQEINLELGRRFHDGAWSFRPFGAVDIYLTRLNGVTEENTYLRPGATALALTFDRLNMTQTFLRSGFDLNFQRNRVALNTGMFYAYELNNPNFETGVRSGARSAKMRGSSLGREILAFNVGGELKVGRAASVFGGYDLQAVVDRSGGVQHIGHVGGAVRW